MNRGPPLPPLGRFWWNLRHNIFICSPIIIEIEIYDKGPPSLLKKVKFFIYWPILMKFETQHFHMFTTNNWDKNLWIGAPLPPPLKKDRFFIYCAIFIKFETQHFQTFTNNNYDRNLWFLLLEKEGGRGKVTPIHKFESQLLLVNIWKCCVSNFIKIAQ